MLFSEFIIFCLIYVIFMNLLINLTFYCLGRLLFKCGFKKVGHYLVGVSIAGDFGLCKKTRDWLHDNCQRGCEFNKCDIWTCGNYEYCKACKHDLEVIIVEPNSLPLYWRVDIMKIINKNKLYKKEMKERQREFERNFQKFLSSLVIKDRDAFMQEIVAVTKEYLVHNPTTTINLDDNGQVVGYGMCLLYDKKIQLTTVSIKSEE